MLFQTNVIGTHVMALSVANKSFKPSQKKFGDFNFFFNYIRNVFFNPGKPNHWSENYKTSFRLALT
jgi:hypothetical protein